MDPPLGPDSYESPVPTVWNVRVFLFHLFSALKDRLFLDTVQPTRSE